MTKTRARRMPLAFLLLATLGTWLLLRELSREEPNYTLIEEGLYMGGSIPEPLPGTTAVLNLCETADAYSREVQAWEAIRDGGPAHAATGCASGWSSSTISVGRTERSTSIATRA